MGTLASSQLTKLVPGDKLSLYSETFSTHEDYQNNFVFHGEQL